MTVVAALFLAAAVEVWQPSPRRLIDLRLGSSGAPLGRRTVRPATALVPVGTLVLVRSDGPALVIGLALVAAAIAVAELAAQARRHATERRRRRDWVDALSFLAAELRAGALPDVALRSVASEEPDLAPVARAASRGGDVVALLRTAAAAPGADALEAVASAWRVAERSGAPVADVLTGLVERIRDEVELEREVEAELAPARATARVMAVLPVMGLALGAGSGADPVHVVTSTWPGAACAALGIGFAVVGLVWMERVAGRIPR